MRHNIGIIVGVWLVLRLLGGEAAAYDCWSPISTAQLYENADVVFIGTVTGVSELPPDPEELNTLRQNISFEIYEAYKGLLMGNKTLTVDTESFYEYDFRIGEFYIIYGYQMYPARVSIIGCPRIEKVNEVNYARLFSLVRPRYIHKEIPADLTGIHYGRKADEAQSQEQQEGAEPISEPPLGEATEGVTELPREEPIEQRQLDQPQPAPVQPVTEGAVTPEPQVTGTEGVPAVAEPAAPEGPVLPEIPVLNGELDKLIKKTEPNGAAKKPDTSEQSKEIEEAIQEEIPLPAPEPLEPFEAPAPLPVPDAPLDGLPSVEEAPSLDAFAPKEAPADMPKDAAPPAAEPPVEEPPATSESGLPLPPPLPPLP